MTRLRTLSRRDIFFSLSLCIVSVLAWRRLASLAALALANERYSHILLVPPVAIALLFLENRDKTATKRSSYADLVSLLVAGVVALVCSRRPDIFRPWSELSVAMFSLVLAWLCLAIIFYGIGTLRRYTFVLLLMLFLVPLPDTLLNAVVAWLQDSSARMTEALFVIAGIPVSKEGFILHIPKIDIEVASECSGIRSTMILILNSLVLGHLFLRSTWRQLILFGFTVFVSVLKNALRIFTISVLAVYVDYSWIEGDFHHRYGGAVFLTFGVALVLGMLAVLHRSDEKAWVSNTSQIASK